MHVLGRAEYRINRAGLDAQRAADAGLLVDHCDQRQLEMLTVFGVEFEYLGIEQVG